MSKYAILVNSCDAFSDCWDPFFKLFTIYWPDFKGKIYLNTEVKDFHYPGLQIISTKTYLTGGTSQVKELPWGERFKRALEMIDSDIILYLQEDYFLKDQVKNDIITDFVETIISNPEVDCIHLTDQAAIPENKIPPYPKLFELRFNQSYRISLQAALWKKEVLLQYVRPYESTWEFEEYGSKRADVLRHHFYVVDPNWVKLNEFEIIPYIFTGITRGRWNEEVIHLFDKVNIKMDYSLRGFMRDIPKKTLWQKLSYQWDKLPVRIKHLKDIQNLKKI